MGNIIKLMASSHFVVLNKLVIKMVGLDAATLLGELASEYEYWDKQKKLKDGFFFFYC